jgi:aarF domain-containing kinase
MEPCRYLKTKCEARRLRRLGGSGVEEAVAELWAQQHERGATALLAMLVELKGFYLKLGQILATKSDVLPKVYTEAFAKLLDNMPCADASYIRSTIRRELGRSVGEVRVDRWYFDRR